MTRGEAIGIGLLGLGVVGGGVAAALLQKPDMLSQHAGSPLILRKVLVRSLSKERTVAIDSSLLSTEIEQVLGDPEIAIVVEVMGGEEPALAYIREALSHSKHVVTANKEVMSKYGDELVALAE
jgi:homoserine dehydrogenase